MKKYYTYFDLYFSERKYSIVGQMDGTKKEMTESIIDFANKNKMEYNLKTKKLFQDGKEIGSFKITSVTI